MIDEDEWMTGTSRIVGEGMGQALTDAINGDVQGALERVDRALKEALAIETNPDRRNEFECRRLEMRFHIASVTKDLQFVGETMQDIGASNRFTSERLHHMISVMGGGFRHWPKGWKS